MRHLLYKINSRSQLQTSTTWPALLITSETTFTTVTLFFIYEKYYVSNQKSNRAWPWHDKTAPANSIGVQRLILTQWWTWLELGFTLNYINKSFEQVLTNSLDRWNANRKQAFTTPVQRTTINAAGMAGFFFELGTTVEWLRCQTSIADSRTSPRLHHRQNLFAWELSSN